jgi:class 3 adenylate cyclase
MSFSPSSDQFARIQPFHLVMDDQMVLQQVGPGIKKLAPTLRLGAPFTDFFEIRRPHVDLTLEAIQGMQQTVFLLQCVDGEITLKGQMLVDDSRRLIFFVGSIVMSEHLELVKHGLTLSDFPIHDSSMDQVMFREQRLLNKKLEGLVHERTVELETEQARSEALLQAMLPKGIVERLKAGETLIADRFANASVLFADLVGFTPLTLELSPIEIIELIGELFSHFDSLIVKYGVEKIRTIGDNYMVASGVPFPRPDHAQALARMALDMSDYIHSRPVHRDKKVDFRIGINSGPLIAGVIGDKKHQYDLWGDTVNTASRMESSGMAGKIQITRATYDLIREEFVCEPRGKVPVKGKGELETWYLLGAKQRR